MSVSTEQQPETFRDATDLAKGAAINLLGAAAKVSKIAFVVFAARWYGTNALGLYFLAYNTADVLSKLALFGLDRSLIHETARRGAERNDLAALRFHLGIGAALTLLVGAALWLVAPVVAQLVFSEPELTLPIRLATLGLPFLIATQILLASVRAQRIMRYDAMIRGAAEPFVLLLVAVALWPLDWGAAGLILAQASAFAVSAFLALVAVRRVYRTARLAGHPVSKDEKRQALRFAAPLAIMDVLNLMVARMDLFLVGTFLNATAAGVYGLLIEIISIMKRVRQAFEPIFAPIVAQLHYGADRGRLQRSYGLVTRWLLAGTLLPLLALTLFGTEVLQLFNISGSEALATLVILAVANALFGVFSAAENLLVMAGHSGLNARLATLMVGLNALAGVVLIPRLGLQGAAMATLLAYTVVSAARVGAGRKRLGVQPFGWSLLWPLLSAGLTFAVIFSIRRVAGPMSLPWALVLFTVTMVLYSFLLLARADQPEERHLLRRMKGILKSRVLARA
jgi:O-antigen/teichoic acid export membrane protein